MISITSHDLASHAATSDNARMLLLKKYLADLVRQGKKTQTIRVWSRPVVQAGKVSYTPGLGPIRILSVELVADFASLTEADAIADGFANRRELLKELHKIYGPTVPEGRKVYRVRFAFPADKTIAPEPPPAVIAQATVSADEVIPPDESTAPIDASKSHMTPAQRQQVRAYILERKPK